jgi:ABC-2 type transport system permease protein
MSESSLWDIAGKEVSDSFSSRRFLLILALFTLFSLASAWMGIQSYQQELEQFRSGGGWAPEKPTLLDVFAPMLSLNMPLAAGILALLLSYDAVSKEREEGTVELLLSYPVYRDEVINGKFLADLFTLSLALLFAYGLTSGLAVYMTGQIPGINVFIRLSFIWLGTIVYMAFFMALGSLFSTVFRSSWRSLIAGTIILLLSVATPFIAGFAARQLYEYDPSGNTQVMEARTTEHGNKVVEEPDTQSISHQEVMAKRERFKDRVSRLSPSNSYRNYVREMLGTSADSEIEPTVSKSIDNAVGYLIFLLSQTFMMFTASYAVFMRQDL